MTPADLLKINVNEHTEKKANLTYLSWAWAWAEALKADPTVTFHVSTFDRGDGVNQVYMDVNGTALVWVTVTMFGKPMTCQLPVMDHRNKPIPNPDAFAVNTAIMRCMTKALALHGLGLYIYAGEDLPEGEEKESKPEPKPEPKKVEAPKDIEGKEGPWQIKVSLKPEGDTRAWVDTVCSMAALALDAANSSADVMQIFKVNRNIFDQLKMVDKSNYDDLMAVFKTRKEKLQ